MAEQTKTSAPVATPAAPAAPAPAKEEVVVVPAVAEKPAATPEKPAAEPATPVVEKEVKADVPVAAEKLAAATPAPVPAPEVVEKEIAAPEPEAPEKPAAVEEEVVETEKDEKVGESTSFKEESNVVADLPNPQQKALDELKKLVQDALNKHELTAPPPPPPAKEEEKKAEPETTVAPVEEESKAEEKKESEAVPESKPEEKKESEVPAVVPVEIPPPAKEETPKPEAVKVVESKVEEKTTAPPPAAEKVVETKVEEKTTAPPPVVEKAVETKVVVEKVIQKVEAVEEDGTKAVEEIKETIVEVTTPAPPPPAAVEEKPKEETTEAPETEAPPPTPEEVSIWGIKLLEDERTDTILLKFLRARDFKVKEAFAMLKSVVAWRKEFGIDDLLEEENISEGLEKVVYLHGNDKEGHPVIYNTFGEFQDKELYNNTFADAEKRSKFLRGTIQFLEKTIRNLDFTPDGLCTLFQIIDLKNSPGLFFFKKDLRQAINQALQLFQDNYPEFIAKQVYINVPWWYPSYYRMTNAIFTSRTKSKFVFAGPSRSAETLFKYIAPEKVPVQYGGLSREVEQEFTTADAATEETIKPASKHKVEFEVPEKCTLVWELRVVGWDVTYGAEFVPSAEEGYTVIVQKTSKIAHADEPIISTSYKIGEPGKVVLTFDNQTSKKKKLLYRSKTKPSD